MAKSKRKKINVGIIVKTVFLVLAILLLLGAVVVAFRFVKGNSNALELEYNNEVVDSETGFEMWLDKSYMFTVDGYSAEDLTVKIIPHISTGSNFMFTVNGVQYAYSKVTDLTDNFDIQVVAGGFTISPLQDLPDMLQRQFEGEVDFVPSAANMQLSYMDLVVSAPDGETATVPILLRRGTPSEGIELDQTNIVF